MRRQYGYRSAPFFWSMDFAEPVSVYECYIHRTKIALNPFTPPRVSYRVEERGSLKEIQRSRKII